VEILRSARYCLVIGLLALVAGFSITWPAGAQAPTLDGVRIVGEPVVGSVLTAVISGSADPASVTFKWCRVGEQPGKCAKGAPVGSGAAYTPVAADVGFRLMVTARTTIDAIDVEVSSAATAPVIAPPAPTPTPTASGLGP